MPEEIDLALRELLNHNMIRYFTMQGIATDISRVILDEVFLLLFSPTNYENGRHVMFRPNSVTKDMNILYHFALRLDNTGITEGAILNSLSGKTTGVRAESNYATRYIDQLSQYNPIADKQSFFDHLNDFVTNGDSRARLRASLEQDKPNTWRNLYYNPDCQLASPSVIFYFRWIRLMLLPYFSLFADESKMQEKLVDLNVKPGFTLLYGMTRNLLLLTPAGKKELEPIVKMMVNGKILDIDDVPYDLEESSTKTNMSFNVYNLGKIQLPILLRRLMPEIIIQIEWNSPLLASYEYPDATKYFICYDESHLKNEVVLTYQGQSVTFKSNNAYLLEGFLNAGMQLGFEPRKLVDTSSTTPLSLTTSIPKYQSHLNLLITL